MAKENELLEEDIRKAKDDVQLEKGNKIKLEKLISDVAMSLRIALRVKLLLYSWYHYFYFWGKVCSNTRNTNFQVLFSVIAT